MICDFCDTTSYEVELSGNDIHCCTECFKKIFYPKLSESGKEHYDKQAAENAFIFNGTASLKSIKEYYVVDSDNRVETTAGKPKLCIGDVIFTVDGKTLIYPKDEFLKRFRWPGRLF